MPKPAFPAKKLREALDPRMTRSEMSRRMGISSVYLGELEEGLAGFPEWPQNRKQDFLHEISAWRKNPKPSKHWGRRAGCKADGSPAAPKPGCRQLVTT